ncbi:50S ribosomal protein L15 [bacterium (Candidatus Gribaldobacteria) CG_4_10_14_0_2_um_filter_36_18]|uniref:Large ribosomal subunit protein uL15 n=1 Tax=bacterium (Candidatus Gribaldobacteria) CG_4_10_14_0_2_um_filter_36_18 TaxID=2014264 RepID=A0A2M7VK99_9BACT|nr:MAG: 50S ribosomal protein L15 [bacterium (Candidatus Gribaldobacteria) CG_4_10_14_0_2_um_filter_36_18]
MKLHQLHKSKKIKRVGRGGKRGTYSGRGQKGQKSRAGRKLQPIIRELIKKYPKLRGYRAKRREKKIVEINIAILNEKFKGGEIINPKILIEKKMIGRIKGKIPIVKILRRGEIKKKLIIEGCQVSKGAREKIEKAGGVVKSKMKSEK